MRASDNNKPRYFAECDLLRSCYMALNHSKERTVEKASGEARMEGRLVWRRKGCLGPRKQGNPNTDISSQNLTAAVAISLLARGSTFGIHVTSSVLRSLKVPSSICPRRTWAVCAHFALLSSPSSSSSPGSTHRIGCTNWLLPLPPASSDWLRPSREQCERNDFSPLPLLLPPSLPRHRRSTRYPHTRKTVSEVNDSDAAATCGDPESEGRVTSTTTARPLRLRSKSPFSLGSIIRQLSPFLHRGIVSPLGVLWCLSWRHVRIWRVCSVHVCLKEAL